MSRTRRTASRADSGPGQMLFTFVRHWSRRSLATVQQAPEQGRLVLVTEAVCTLARRGTEATVNAVADEVGFDQSGASRLVKAAVDAGYLETRTSAADGRRRELTVTPSGITLLRDAHAWQEQVFDRLADGWSEQQRRDFQRAMASLIERSYSLDA